VEIGGARRQRGRRFDPDMAESRYREFAQRLGRSGRSVIARLTAKEEDKMGIFTRARDIISANINALLDEAEDPEKLVSLMVREMEDTLIELKASCAGAMAAKRRVQRDKDFARERAEDWSCRAQRAVEKGRDDLAREALIERRRHSERCEALDRELGHIDRLVEQYQADINHLEGKLKTARERQRVLVQRHIHALRKRRAEVDIRRFDDAEVFARFDQVEQRIERMEADADLVNLGRRPTLQEEIDALDDNGEIEKELQQLKAASSVRGSSS
jgi:phage shock protein A